jgi:Skp family chaperone for outer membrane proteins
VSARKIRIDVDEWYPFYSLREDFGHEFEVTQEQLDRWEAAFHAFEAAQSELADLHEAAERACRERALAEKEAREKAAREKAEAERRAFAKAQADAEKAQAKVRQALTDSDGLVYSKDGTLIGRVNDLRAIRKAGESDE